MVQKLRISFFSLNRKKKILTLQKDLINFISNYIKKKNYKNFIETISKKLNLKITTLNQETKIYLFSKFYNNKGRFDKIFNLIYLPISALYCLAIIIYIKIFENTKIPQIFFYEIIVDGIDVNNIKKINKFSKISKKKKTLYIIYGEKVNLLSEKNFFFFNYKNIYLEKKKNISLFNHIQLIFFSIFTSFKLKENILPILINFIIKYYKYNSIFFSNRSKFIIQERFYDTSAIKDEIFHNYNGKLSCVLQKNLFQINGPGMFVNADTLFSLGNQSLPKIKNFNCKIKNIVPIGSLFMEYSYFNHPDFLNKRANKNKFNFDILIFASSHTSSFHSGYDSYYSEYYEHFKWIKKIAVKYPKLKIAIKHQGNFNDTNEIKIFNNVKNVKYVTDRSPQYSDSYLFAKHSKALFTWSSTLCLESIALNKNCYFLDPYNSNFAFLPNNKVFNKIRITSFKKFEEIINQQIRNEINFKTLDRDKYCLKSNITSENIIKYFNKNI